MLVPLSDLGNYLNKDVQLYAQLVGRRICRSDTGYDFYRLQFVENGQAIDGVVWWNSPIYGLVGQLDLSVPPRVEVLGHVDGNKQSLRIRISNLCVAYQSLNKGNSAWMIPIQALDAYFMLFDYLQNISKSGLATFMSAVFLDEEITPAYLRCRGSVNHHHKFMGGLLVHSVQVANLVQTQSICLGLSQEETELGIAGALLHDLGKIEVVGESNPRPRDPGLFSHEVTTIKLLAPHLKLLKAIDSRTAWTMEHIFHQMIPAQKSKIASLVICDLIRTADQLSAASNNNKGIDDFLSIGKHSQLHPKNVEAFQKKQMGLFHEPDLGVG